MALPLDQADIPQELKADPCGRCGHPSEVAIWGHRVCYSCVADWSDLADATPELSGPGDKSMAYKAFTAAWLVRSKRGAA
jgi:hypothetical protein